MGAMDWEDQLVTLLDRRGGGGGVIPIIGQCGLDRRVIDPHFGLWLNF